MGIHQDILRNHDWQRTIRAGAEMAAEMVRSDVRADERHVIWALLVEAAQVSRRAYTSPPRTRLPSKSALPEAAEDVTYWHRIMAYLRGEIEEMDAGTTRPPLPTAEQISRCEIILHIWHHYALVRKGDRSRIKRAVYLKACGVPDRKVRAVTGLTRQSLHSAKDEAMRDMWEVIRRY